jgi:hypothetical protein
VERSILTMAKASGSRLTVRSEEQVSLERLFLGRSNPRMPGGCTILGFIWRCTMEFVDYLGNGRGSVNSTSTGRVTTNSHDYYVCPSTMQ